MEYIVKFNTVSFLVEAPNIFDPGKTKLVPRIARHGQRVSTDTEGNDPNTIYGLREYDENKLLALGAFFSPHEVRAFEDGLTDETSTEQDAARLNVPRGDTGSTPRYPALGEDANIHGGEHPLAFGETPVEKLGDWIMQNDIPVNELLEIVEGDPSLANKVLQAENLATGSEPREGLAQGIAAILGTATGPAPKGSEGVEGTAPDEGEGRDAAGASIDATGAAVELADQEGVDLAEVEGTGNSGRITKDDVESYLASREQQ